MVREAALMLGLLASGAAYAGTPLWGKVEADMPLADVKAAYPEGKVAGSGVRFKEKVEGCTRNVVISMDREVSDPAAKVKEVFLIGSSCGPRIFEQLVAKYGEPRDLSYGDPLGFYGKNDFNKTARWASEGRSIVYKLQGDIISTVWTLTYAPVKDLGL